MTASSDAIINYRRRPRIPPPLFVRVGDFVAELIIVGILLGGFLTGGYAQIPRWMWMVNGGCAFLGTWAVAGLLLGRWQERTMRASLWFMAAFTVVVVWSGLQHPYRLYGAIWRSPWPASAWNVPSTCLWL
jgi:hypothetical protein